MLDFKERNVTLGGRGYGLITGPELQERLAVETSRMAVVNDGEIPRLPTAKDKRKLRQRGRCGLHGRKLT